ncbi:MAG TPA: OsmC family protein [bacterium]|uniref:OsmC-like protein n=1 Tax=candidate division TA06 bacterium ADurb.Bin417 TaxID=1852828 RepID=A0A1V5M6Q8_UNCT6|nr:MAG: OsmC-like protein [candidate division TA06 bacterium ADurb.Bin417]HNQ34988.1 OsmC family protein [bacterium]HNS49343.1 OsmC family protein [bacterium]
MEELKVKFRKGRSFEASIRQHRLPVDLPLGLKGSDTGPTPPDYLVLSLASCVGMYVLFFCERSGLSPEGLEVQAEYAKDQERITSIAVSVRLPSAETEERRREALGWAEKCLIHRTLCERPDLKISLR